jgi:hypothetical protein
METRQFREAGLRELIEVLRVYQLLRLRLLKLQQ